jgi:hypothetical protein
MHDEQYDTATTMSFTNVPDELRDMKRSPAYLIGGSAAIH